MDKVKKVFNTLFLILDIIIVVVLIGVFSNYIQISVFNKKYSDFFGYSFFVIKTGSMSGTLEIDDCIIVKITPDVNENDIISYLEDNSVITHRLIQVTEDNYITQGDANTGKDKPISKSSVIGKVVKIIPRFGIWVKVFSEKQVIIPIVITVILFGITLSIGDNKTSRRRERRRKRRVNEEEEKKV